MIGPLKRSLEPAHRWIEPTDGSHLSPVEGARSRRTGRGRCRALLPGTMVIGALAFAACGGDVTPTGNAHLESSPIEFPAFVPGEFRLRIQGSAEGEYRQTGAFFLEEGRPTGPAAEQWGGYYSNFERRDSAVDTLVQLLGWGPLPEGRRTIPAVRPQSSSDFNPFVALSPALYAHPLSFTFLPLNFYQPDAPLVYLTTDGSYVEFRRIDLPEIDPLLRRGVGGQIQAHLKLRMRGYRLLRSDAGTEFLATAEVIEVLGSLDLPVVRDWLGDGNPGG